MEELTELGRYILVDKIASGGMADVYRAKLIGVEGFVKDLAVKKILPHWSSNREFVDMLIDEAKILLHLTHANIVQVYELNKEADTYFLVMEYVDGVDLRKLTQALKKSGRPFSLTLLCHVVQQICQGLQFAHEKMDRSSRPLGIVHRDISPQNILLSSDGEVKITDFGIARVFGKTNETVTGTLKGKFSYMSPEQALGQRVDHRTDIFALGILLYEMATGERCFKGENDLETLEAVKRAEVIFPEHSIDRVPALLKSIILKALRRTKEERYQSVSEMRADLRGMENQLNLSVSAYELKSLVQELFPEKFMEERLKDEVSQRTRLHMNTEVVKENTLSRRTRVLVGGLEEVEARPQHYDQATVIHGATPSDPEPSLSKTILDSELQLPPAVSSLPVPVAKSMDVKEPFPWLYGLAVLAVLLVAWGFYGLLTDSHPVKKAVVEPVKEEPEVTTTDLVSPPVIPPKEIKSEEPPKPPQEAVGPLKVDGIPPPLQPGPPALEAIVKTFPVSLSVTADPADAQVTISYDQEKKTGVGSQVVSFQLDKQKTFTVKVEKNGYITQTRKVILSEKKNQFEEAISLKKSVFGSVVISATPWGTVVIPGVTSGQETPFRSSKVPVGRYAVKVISPQKQTYTATINVTEGGSVKCRVAFGPNAQLSCSQ